MNTLTGPVTLPSGATLVSAFNEIASLSAVLEKVKKSDEQGIYYKSAIMTYQGICRDLQKIDVSKWLNIGIGAGWTVYGAVALSWCKDARIEHVREGWEVSGFPLKPLPEFERPARFINPELLPKTSSLAAIINFCPNETLPICAMIAALKEPLVFDLPTEHLKNANPQLASFLKSRMEQNGDRIPEQNGLIQTWTQTAKDTEWEI